MLFNILAVLWILASFVGAGKRMTEREASFKNFGVVIAEFIFYPVIRALEEFELELF